MKLVDNKVTKFVTKRKSWIRQILVAAIASAFAWFLGDTLVNNGGLVAAIICNCFQIVLCFKYIGGGKQYP